MRVTDVRINRAGRPAFTLVELLVVIGIIAMLIAILLPALNAARGQAQTLVCMANMRSMGQALASYVTENKGYLPGPNTSGRSLNQNEWRPGVPDRWTDETDPSEPTFNMDWVSPTLGRSLGLPQNRADRLISIFQTRLRCPTNTLPYAAVFGGSGGWPAKYANPAEILTSSYSAVLGFHYWPGDDLGNVPYGLVGNPGETSDFRLPSGYAPRITSVGPAAEKIYVVDGTRYHNGTAEGERYAFRHRKQMNVVFFDGHCESITGWDARRAGRYWPQGTRIPSPYTP